MPVPRSGFVAGAAALVATAGAALGFDEHVFVATTDGFEGTGSCAAFGIEDPWPSSTGLEPTGPGSVVRHFFGLHYVVRPQSGDVQVIDPATFETLRTFSVGAGSEPRDIAVVEAGRAYVSRRAGPLLYEVDPRTGALRDTVDLSPFADADGNPEMETMALDGHRLFVQIQRLDGGGEPVPPSWLAVVDVRTNELVDCDASLPGVQGIRLGHTRPAHKMQIEGRRLYVSVPGTFHDAAGGIEAIDLDALASVGFVTRESQVPLDIGPFALTSPERGYVVTHTDFALSSHLQPFSRIDGSGLGQELTVSFSQVDSIAYDPPTGQLFFPDPDVAGVRVFDAASGRQVTDVPVDAGGTPVDLAIARAATPGEATGLRVTARDKETGLLALGYTPGCAAADHTIVSGPLEAVASYGYADQVCGIGNGGAFDGFDPGPGSVFFLVVGNDGAATEGSYGLDGAGAERPEDLADPRCALDRDLDRRCDGTSR